MLAVTLRYRQEIPVCSSTSSACRSLSAARGATLPPAGEAPLLRQDPRNPTAILDVCFFKVTGHFKIKIFNTFGNIIYEVTQTLKK